MKNYILKNLNVIRRSTPTNAFTIHKNSFGLERRNREVHDVLANDNTNMQKKFLLQKLVTRPTIILGSTYGLHGGAWFNVHYQIVDLGFSRMCKDPV
jgi:hypothetical protein